MTGVPSLPGWIATAAELTALADWIDNELAGEHADRQAIAETAADTVRAIADSLRETGGSHGGISSAAPDPADQLAEVARLAAREFLGGFFFGGPSRRRS
jgi:hypothetical protein